LVADEPTVVLYVWGRAYQLQDSELSQVSSSMQQLSGNYWF